MRFFHLMPRVVLLIFAVAYFALWAWHPIASEPDPPWRVLYPMMNYLFPALLYGLAAIAFLPGRQASGESAREAQPASRDTAPLFTLAAALYLPMLAMTAIEMWKDASERIRCGFSVPLGVCFFLLFLSFVYEQTSSRKEWNASSKARRLEKLWQGTGRWFLRVAGWLRPGLLLSAGAILVLASVFLPMTDGTGLAVLDVTGLAVLRGDQPWITSIEYVTGRIEAIQSTKAILGRGTYLLALGVAAATVILLFSRKLRAQASSPSRLRAGLTALATFLAIYSAADLNFGWLGLNAGGRDNVHWTLFCLWLILWLLPLALSAWLLLRDHATSGAFQMHSLHGLMMLFLPVVLFDVVMAPGLVGRELNLTGLACYVVGLQFLCWGFVRWGPTTPMRPRVSTT